MNLISQRCQLFRLPYSVINTQTSLWDTCLATTLVCMRDSEILRALFYTLMTPSVHMYVACHLSIEGSDVIDHVHFMLLGRLTSINDG